MNSIKNIIAVLFLLVTILTGCQAKFIYEVTRNNHGISIKMDSLFINIEVVDDAIIHVTKSLSGEKHSKLPDYVRVLENQNVNWEVSESKKQVVISTNKVQVLINSNGAIEYQDIEGRNYVAETNELSYINPNDKNRMVSQSFVAEDEALYGLGQYQSGILNWKNVPNRLEQFNQEVALPFILSTKNYGIYWHNYSVTDFNQPQNEIEFSEIVFSYSETSKMLNIKNGKGNYINFKKDPMKFSVEVVGSKKKQIVEFLGEEMQLVL